MQRIVVAQRSKEQGIVVHFVDTTWLRYILEVRINKGKFLKVVLLTLITRVGYSYYSLFRLEFHIVPCLPSVNRLQW